MKTTTILVLLFIGILLCDLSNARRRSRNRELSPRPSTGGRDRVSRPRSQSPASPRSSSRPRSPKNPKSTKSRPVSPVKSPSRGSRGRG